MITSGALAGTAGDLSAPGSPPRPAPLQAAPAHAARPDCPPGSPTAHDHDHGHSHGRDHHHGPLDRPARALRTRPAPAERSPAVLPGFAQGRALWRDRAALAPAQVAEMLAELRRELLVRYGTADEAAVNRAQRRTGIVVPVRFHVIADGRDGRLSRATALRQIDVLNAAYSGEGGGTDTGVRFRLAGYDVTQNASWFRNPQAHERRMKAALNRGGAGTLNLYTAAVGVEVLGFSTYPQNYRSRPEEDGVVVDYRSVPGGAYRQYDHGYTAVHEVGHWLGLFHTFENGCNAPGDGVDDTPYEAVPTEGCPISKDTCPAAGNDPIHNFMDYAWDACMQEFTPGQAVRIRAAWAAFRSSGDR
ncbi:zinc metalloprotease [Thermomonospora amylolytica]|uniref:zinc metalloprotease n=1 Tax=Thermomonospora amylolytica TaxID=1411117 RepID=UPI001EEE5BAC|nr:zinc metalloprotease [Thermomonospora amylolytica]